MSALFKLAVVVGLLSAVAIMLEKHLPPMEEQVTDVGQLSKGLQEWRRRGKLYDVHGYQMFAIVEGKGPETIVLFHGFPASSYDYNRALEHLTKEYRVVLFDHLGFGFSDKPDEVYTYSLVDQAEMALSLLGVLGVDTGVHAVAHDMGDSILTEILARRDRGMMPDRFKDLFKSVTFTNGGMLLDLANLRVLQSIFRSTGFAPFLTSLATKLPREWVNVPYSAQLRSIWSPSYSDPHQMEEDIGDLLALKSFNGGDKLTHKTMSYLNDRSRLEPRWMSALSRLDVPVMLFWGDSDAVSPMDIPKALVRDHIRQDMFTGKTMKGTGHFLMLESPKAWADTIKEFVSGVSKKKAPSKPSKATTQEGAEKEDGST